MDDADDDPDQQYAWEGTYERPWEAVSQAADGSLVGASAGRRRGQARPVQVGVKRGVLRSIFLVLDASKQAADSDADMRPSRLAVEVDAASAFVRDFFDQNPISTLAVIATRDGRAELLTELSCNPRHHLQALAKLGEEGGRGESSLQNALELARESLHAVPSFTSREVLLLSASLNTCDPGDIHTTVAALKRDKLRTSVFSLLAEIYIHRRIAEVTGGDFGVCASAAHLRDLVLGLVPPRPSEVAGGSAPTNNLIRVGFPLKRAREAGALAAFSAGGGMAVAVSEAPYRCPQCEACHTELPTQCQVCQLKLMSSVELTKTYHHLFPVASFAEAERPVPVGEGTAANGRSSGGGRSSGSGGSSLADGPPDGLCFGCFDRLPVTAATVTIGAAGTSATAKALGYECPTCKRIFCAACDELVHGVLHTCPGCELAGAK